MTAGKYREGTLYEGSLPEQEGVVCDFFRAAGNILLIFVSGLSRSEVRALRTGEVRAGFLTKDGAILLLWQFGPASDPSFTFDTPFDVRFIPDLTMPKGRRPATGLDFEIHMVDAESEMLRVHRRMAFPTDLASAFVNAAREQLGSRQQTDRTLEKWMSRSPEDLLKSAKMWPLNPDPST